MLGRRTYEVVLGFDAWPYGERPVFVLVSNAVHVPEGLERSVRCLSVDPIAVVRQLEALGYRHIWVDGGETVRRFLRAGLIDELVLTRVPVLIGSGIPLFGPLDADVALEHVQTRTLPNGLIQSTYLVPARSL